MVCMKILGSYQWYSCAMINQFITRLIITLGFISGFCSISNADELNSALKLTPDPVNGKSIYPLCASCHLDSGWGKQDGSFPVIAGQHRNVLIKQLADIRAKNRHNPTMYPFADPESIGGAQAIADVTGYISKLQVNPRPGTGNGLDVKQGRDLYIQLCSGCHGDSAEGDNEAMYPKLQGQHYAYLLRQLIWIRDGYRKNSDPYMLRVVKTLNNDQLSAVSDYLSRITTDTNKDNKN